MSQELKNPPNPHIQVTHINKSVAADYDYITKVILLGDSGVGKSSILRMFTEYKFDCNSMATMGIDFGVALMKITHLDDNDNKANANTIDSNIGKYLTLTNQSGLRKQIKHPIFKLQVWDCAGQDKFHTIIRSYIRGAHIVIYTFDITDRISFQKLNKWKESVENEIGKPDEGRYMCIVVGNKLDIETEREVSRDCARKFASELNTVYAEVSATKDDNVQRLFEEIIKIMYRKLLNGNMKIDHKYSVPTANFSMVTIKNPLDDDTPGCLPGNCQLL